MDRVCVCSEHWDTLSKGLVLCETPEGIACLYDLVHYRTVFCNSSADLWR